MFHGLGLILLICIAWNTALPGRIRQEEEDRKQKEWDDGFDARLEAWDPGGIEDLEY